MIKLPVLVDVDCIHPRTWNPNQMSDDKFNQLVEKIDEEDFTDPLKVCPMSPEEKQKLNIDDPPAAPLDLGRGAQVAGS